MPCTSSWFTFLTRRDLCFEILHVKLSPQVFRKSSFGLQHKCEAWATIWCHSRWPSGWVSGFEVVGSTPGFGETKANQLPSIALKKKKKKINSAVVNFNLRLVKHHGPLELELIGWTYWRMWLVHLNLIDRKSNPMNQSNCVNRAPSPVHGCFEAFYIFHTHFISWGSPESPSCALF